mgnify:CR=1 FL=1|tara:strand:- start:1681 stop:2442 length:762 start_codon:yes stop_codon:yes gene_type:complete
MIDSHCHLDHQPLLSNIDDVIKRSKQEGIEKLLTICTTLKSFNQIIKLIKHDQIIFGTFGIHPHETSQDKVLKEEIIKNFNKNEKIIGIGETGLDFFYNNSDKLSQIESFKEHIEAAIHLDCPLIVHSRNAEKETYEILNEYKDEKPKILMHCFTGSTTFASKLFELNCFFSASGIITFKNSLELQETFKTIPIDKLLIETDSPYLAPVPNRGKKNEPSFIRFTAKKLAEIKSLHVSQIIENTTNNFNKLFFN